MWGAAGRLALLVNDIEARPLFGREDTAHPKEHHRAGLVELGAGGLHAINLLGQDGVVRAVNQTGQLLLGGVQLPFAAFQVWQGAGEQVFKSPGLVGGQAKATLDPPVSPPRKPLCLGSAGQQEAGQRQGDNPGQGAGQRSERHA